MLTQQVIIMIQKEEQINMYCKSADYIKYGNALIIIFSFLRVIYFWDEDIKLIISDECDSFLDIETRNLFIETKRK